MSFSLISLWFVYLALIAPGILVILIVIVGGRSELHVDDVCITTAHREEVFSTDTVQGERYCPQQIAHGRDFHFNARDM